MGGACCCCAAAAAVLPTRGAAVIAVDGPEEGGAVTPRVGTLSGAGAVAGADAGGSEAGPIDVESATFCLCLS